MALLLFALSLVLGAAFASLAMTVGVDSREGFDDPRQPADPLGIA